MKNDNAKYIIQAAFVFIGIVFIVKLFFIQVVDKTYKSAADNNVMRGIVEYPYRGIIKDRNGLLILQNNPVYDIMVIPKEVKQIDTLALCKLLNITKPIFKEKIKTAVKKRTSILPSVFIKQIPNDEFARIQDKLSSFSGFHILVRTVRNYPAKSLSNALGYMREIDKRGLKRDTSNYYKQGDYIGINGLEKQYEKQLRGKRGVQYKMVNVKGVIKGSFKNSEYDTLSVPGENLISSIDLPLQQYAEKLMAGKLGSIVAIEPSSGEILSMVSGPFYDPNTLTGRDLSSNYRKLVQDTLKPLFNRPVMATYPPGSIFKTLQALIALQEGVIGPTERIYCPGGLIGDHAPPGSYDIKRGIQYSSNNFFYKLFRRIINQKKDPNTFVDSNIGLENWKSYMSRFGLGRRIGIDIPGEKTGLVPAPSYYDYYYGKHQWKFSTIASLSIGQGELLMTPLQMANLSATIANKGYYYTPHIVKGIGKEGKPLPEFTIKNEVGIDAAYYDIVIEGMQAALAGTASRAIIPDIEICGKTGTAENPHGEDHSVFMAFAPKDNPKIAISVYVENAKWGGRAAASIASLMIEHYLRENHEITRPWLEEYVLKGHFVY